jgi:hypothetical protein
MYVGLRGIQPLRMPERGNRLLMMVLLRQESTPYPVLS